MKASAWLARFRAGRCFLHFLCLVRRPLRYRFHAYGLWREVRELFAPRDRTGLD